MGSDTDIQAVTLALGREVFAVPIEVVREILDYAEPFGVPDGPAYLLGITDVRGRAVPTLDLRVKLGLPRVEPTSSTRILVLDVPLEGRTLSLGLVADRVIEVVTIARDALGPAPEIGVAWRSDYIEGVVRRDDGFVILFNLAALLTTDDAGLALEHAA